MLIFISIALGAFIIVAGSLLFGHDGDAGHDAGHDAGGHDAGDAGHDAGDATVSVFSSKVIGTLLMGFGSAGAIAMHYDLGYLVSSLIGLGCGLLLGFLMWLVLGVFYKQQSSSLVATSSSVGCQGRVITTIVEGGQGEVGIQVEGQYCTFLASSRDGRAIAKGQSVRVVQTHGSQLVVDRA